MESKEVKRYLKELGYKVHIAFNRYAGCRLIAFEQPISFDEKETIEELLIEKIEDWFSAGIGIHPYSIKQ